jgi:hypothetical protein
MQCGRTVQVCHEREAIMGYQVCDNRNLNIRRTTQCIHKHIENKFHELVIIL